MIPDPPQLLEVEWVEPATIRPYDKNAKKHPRPQVQKIADSIREFGFNQPIVVDKDGVIIVGHGRYEASRLLKMDKVPIVTADLTEEQAKAYRLADNKLNESDWDMDLVVGELGGMSLPMLDLTGFTLEDIDRNTPKYQEGQKDALREKYIIPPFSIFDTKQAYWRDRKKQWMGLIGDSGEGRSDTLLGEGLKRLAQAGKSASLTGTSIFDPVLCEIAYRWFNVEGGRVLDPFAGGSARGLVASILGYPYTGIDLSAEQIAANEKKAAELSEKPAWIHGNSNDLETLVPDGDYDMLFTCPPYYDLEQYTDDPSDLSNKGTYEDFIAEYKAIIAKAAAKLRNDRFAVFVVGEIRDKDGNYRGFVGDTIAAFKEAGLTHYNDIILANAIATASLRAKNTFENNRKVVKVHQNVLVFAKGKPEQYREAYAQLPKIERYHDNVLVFYKGDIEEIRKNYKVVNTDLDYLGAGLEAPEPE